MRNIQLSNGDVALVDDDDVELLAQYRWHCSVGRYTSYAYCWNPYPTAVMMHRMLMNPPDGMVVDHLNWNGLDNRRENLKIVTQSFNVHRTRSQPKGYTWEESRQKWKVSIMIDGKSHYLGRFNTEEEAAVAYQSHKQSIFGD